MYKGKKTHIYKSNASLINYTFAQNSFRMNVSIEISYYPLNREFVPPIREFIERLNSHNGLIVKTNGMSTQVFGEYNMVMDSLKEEIGKSFENPHSVFVMKVINADLNNREG
jgi:uncharacterized protein YqgV (UPF0045/DUF77 family)